MMWSILRYMLFPFTIIYAFIVWLRNRFYDLHIIPSYSFSIPTIVIGNLAVGGTGKSPMTEAIVSFLSKKFKIAILSRGYGRITKGFHFVEVNSLATEVGDEPLQFKNKFPNITVAVCEDRCKGIQKLKGNHEVIILDDAYQHRKLSPLFTILLFDYQSFSRPMFVFPVGNFRDLLLEAKRAHIIVITKCPVPISDKDKIRIESKLRRYNKEALIVFSHIDYFEPVRSDGTQISIDHKDIILITGIANPQTLVQYISHKAKSVSHLSFGDHHTFKETDINYIIETFKSCKSNNKIILTTEKDYQRLKPYQDHFDSIELAYLPIKLQFSDVVQKNQFYWMVSDTVQRSVNQP